jgi:hypothetical protein
MAFELSARESRPVRARDGGVPVYAYGGINVLAVSPTYDPRLVLQAGCTAAWRPIEPKKSWQVTRNYLGLTPTRLPNSSEPELSPYAAARMIDGNPRTYGVTCAPPGDPALARAWVRVVLPRPATLSCVRLIPPPATSPARAPSRFTSEL